MILFMNGTTIHLTLKGTKTMKHKLPEVSATKVQVNGNTENIVSTADLVNDTAKDEYRPQPISRFNQLRPYFVKIKFKGLDEIQEFRVKKDEGLRLLSYAQNPNRVNDKPYDLFILDCLPMIKVAIKLSEIQVIRLSELFSIAFPTEDDNPTDTLDYEFCKRHCEETDDPFLEEYDGDIEIYLKGMQVAHSFSCLDADETFEFYQHLEDCTDAFGWPHFHDVDGELITVNPAEIVYISIPVAKFQYAEAWLERLELLAQPD